MAATVPAIGAAVMVSAIGAAVMVSQSELVAFHDGLRLPDSLNVFEPPLASPA